MILVVILVLVVGGASGLCSDDGHIQCEGDENCVNSTQLCDGHVDCAGGSDESVSNCVKRQCPHPGVLCENSSVCLSDPGSEVCSKASPVCPDRSDQAFCLHYIFTGCFLNTSLGLRLTSCDTCFCEIIDMGYTKRRRVWMYETKDKKQETGTIIGRICMERSSSLVCDGKEDCFYGEDEDSLLCDKKLMGLNTTVANDHNEQEFDISKVADNPGKEEVDNKEIGINFKLLVFIFLSSFGLVVGLSSLFLFILLRVTRKNPEARQQIRMDPHFQRQASNNSHNDYVTTPHSQKDEDPGWRLERPNIVKELGTGFYSTVYLVKNDLAGFVAVKVVEKQKDPTLTAMECINNEISVLDRLPSHLNIIKLIGFNKLEGLLVLEYCQQGNLKEYITQSREYFTDELDPITGELKEGALLYRCPSVDDVICSPMVDFITSLHTDVENKKEDRRKGVPSLTMSMNILNTRRLLYWSYQISKGFSYLFEQGIIHRDVALRNMLLTDHDIVKVGDFGLAVTGITRQNTLMGPISYPQYWSRSNKPQPYKWMALECLETSVFSHKSDVWAFGICLWEMFTLGLEPYGEVSPREIVDLLQSGDRLTTCTRAPSKVREMIKSCWIEDPNLRPDMPDLRSTLTRYISRSSRTRLDSGVCEGYVEMETLKNDPEIERRDKLYWSNYKMLQGPPVKVLINESSAIDYDTNNEKNTIENNTEEEDDEIEEDVMVDSSDQQYLI